MKKVASKWIRNASDRLAVKLGCYFDVKLGERACQFIEKFCRQSKGRWAGEPLELLDWQRDFIMRLFGWRRADGTRRFRRAYLEVAKKNGKSTMVSALVLLLLLADGEGAPEVYLNAVDREQASIVFDEAARMVRANPDLLARLKVIDSKKRILDPSGNGKLVANSADVPSKDGANASAWVFDEVHRQKNREMYEVFRYAGASREQPLEIDITTAGEDESGVWFELREYSENVNRGKIQDITHLGVVYRADEKDDIDDPATWRKANPSLGYTLNAEDFRNDLEEAKQSPVNLANFKRLRLNIITRGSTHFVASEAWDACDGEPEPLDGEPCWMGLDLSTTTDLSALVLLVGDEDEGFGAVYRFWVPEDNVAKLEARDRQPYGLWIQQGLVKATPGAVIDYDFIIDEIRDLACRYQVQKINIDPYNATSVATRLMAEGLPVEFLRQGYLSLSAPTKHLERWILAGTFRHGGHPVMRWMSGNAVVEKDSAGNIKLSKRKSRQKIDGMSATVNATAAVIAGESEDTGPSVYESRGILTI